MSFGEILVLAVGLAMDATAVSAATATLARDIRARDVIRVALLFGGSQALMPLLGWVIGDWSGPWIQQWDHWIAFGLLGGLGTKMLWDSWHAVPESIEITERSGFGWRPLSVLAFATSVDAFAVGITLPMLRAPMLLSLTTIGVTTALLSAMAAVVGHRVGAMFGRRLDAFGGVVLIGLGTKILVDHLGA